MVTMSNLPTINTLGNLHKNSSGNKSQQRHASGLHINTSADDAVGMPISSKISAQITGLFQTNRNAQDGISLMQTADGTLNEVVNILRRMRELFMQASNDTVTEKDREAVNLEIAQLKTEVNSISAKTMFNKKLLFGTEGEMLLEGVEEEDNLAVVLPKVRLYYCP